MMAPFGYLEHTADACLRGTEATLEGAFCEAARAMFHLMVDIAQVRPQKCIQVFVTAEKVELLLVEWLAELLVRKDLENVLLSRFRVDISEQDKRFDLQGEGWGEALDPMRHRVKTEVKGVAYAGLRVCREGDQWVAQCVVDI